MAFVRGSAFRAGNTERTAVMTDFSGGVRLGSPYDCENGSVPVLENMWIEGGILSARPGWRLFCELGGTPHSHCELDSGTLIHSGGKLYLLSDGNIKEIAETEDLPSIMFPFAQYVYLMTENGYYRTDGETFEEVEPYVPTVMIDRAADGSSGVKNEDFNLIGRDFTVQFNYSGNGDYLLPEASLADFPPKVVLNGNDISESCTLDTEKGIITVNTLLNIGNEGISNLHVTVRLDEEAKKEEYEKIFGCTVWENFGGTSGEGTRIFLSGNPKYPTHCFRSGLLDPTYFPDTAFELIGFGNERIVAMKKQYDELIVFCESSVHAVCYKNAGEAVIFTRRTINSEIGCDLKDSVQLLNNNLVFANRKKGVFMISSTISETENNVVPISVNIEPTETGFFAAAKSGNVWSADLDGKYFLFASGYCFVWDYGRVPYRNGSDLRAAQRRLCWYVFTDTLNGKMPFIYRKSLCCFTENGIAVFGESDSDMGAPIVSKIVTAPSGLGAPRYEKCPVELFAVYKGSGKTAAEITFYHNGEEAAGSSCGKIKLLSSTFSFDRFDWSNFSFLIKKLTRYFKARLRLPKAYTYSVQIVSDMGGFKLERLEIKYRI